VVEGGALRRLAVSNTQDIFIVPKDYVFRPFGWRESSFVVDGKTYYMLFNTVRVPENEKEKNDV
tara:strand:+ start:2567 stop:2758 length:192 start_codon:yes stop_codon:yes gene_type:complete